MPHRVIDLTPEKKELLKELSRRRLSLLFFAAGLVATIFTVVEESDTLLHALDDYSIVGFSVAAFLLIAFMRNRQSLADLRKLNNVTVIIAAVLFMLVIFAVTQEFNDAADFGDEPAALIFILVLIINRFL